MSMQMQAQVKPTSASTSGFTFVQTDLLQRKCALGGAAGMSGERSKKKRFGLQTKLKVNEPGDIYEQEADRIADQMMATPAHSTVSGAPPRIQRFSGQSNGQMDSAPASVDHALASPGRPLEPALRQDMEQRFGHDFSRVRVHSDADAGQSARDVNANAYTVGHDMVFGAGRFAPGTQEGRRLLAHELTHVVQQSGPEGIRVWKSDEERVQSPIYTDDFYERQADGAAERVIHGGKAPALESAFQGRVQAFRLQRDPADYDGLTIDELRRRAVTDPEAAEALRLRFRAMSNVELERYARADPMAQSVYEQRNIVPAAAEGQGQFGRPGIQQSLAQDIQQERAAIERSGGAVRRAPSAAIPGGRTQGGTIGAARTDIPGLENRVFIGRSPQAGGQVNPASRFAPPTDPAVLPQTHGHAEQAIADQLEQALRSVPREQLAGRRVWMLIEQEPCSTCAQGVVDPAVEAGVLRRLSAAFPELTFEVKSLDSSALTVLRNGARVAQGAAPTAAATGQGQQAGTNPVQVETQIRALSTVRQPNGTTISEIEYTFGENLEHLNRGAPSGGQIPGRMVMRVTQNAEGAITAVESLSGQPQAMAEALVRQTLPSALSGELAGAEGGAAEGVAAGTRGMARLAQGLKIGGWIAFAVITGYQLATATPAQRPRVLAQAGGGLAGGIVTGYVVCNLLLDLETAGWGIIICGFIAGGAGGYAGSHVAGEAYDEATRTELDRALQDLERAPRNVRVLFNVLVGDGQGLDASFVRRFMSIVPFDLRDYELVILSGQLGTAPSRTVSAGTPSFPQPRTGQTHASAAAQRGMQLDTVCPNCHRAVAEGRSTFGGHELTDEDRRTIASWIAAQPQQVAPAPSPPDRSHLSHAPTVQGTAQGFPTIAEQQGTVCPNCHREVRESRRPQFPSAQLNVLLSSRRSGLGARLEALRLAISRLPERQRAPGDISHPAPTPALSGQLGTVCPNCHRGAGEGQSQSPLRGQQRLTDQDRQAIARWIQSQQRPAAPPADRSHAAPCPNCHRTADRPQSGSLLERAGGFGSGPGGQMTDADRRRLLEWLEGQQH